MELWFQVQDTETGAALAPPRELLRDAQADRRKLVEPGKSKIQKVQAKAGRGNLPTMARGAR